MSDISSVVQAAPDSRRKLAIRLDSRRKRILLAADRGDISSNMRMYYLEGLNHIETLISEVEGAYDNFCAGLTEFGMHLRRHEYKEAYMMLRDIVAAQEGYSSEQYARALLPIADIPCQYAQ